MLSSSNNVTKLSTLRVVKVAQMRFEVLCAVMWFFRFCFISAEYISICDIYTFCAFHVEKHTNT